MYGETSTRKSFWVHVDVNNWATAPKHVCKYKDPHYRIKIIATKSIHEKVRFN